MTPEQIFTIANGTAVAAWVLLAVRPRARWVGTLTTLVVPLLFAAAYVVIAATTLWSTPGSFQTLAGVTQLFSNPWLLLAGWLHYLAFDLLVGAWIVRDAARRGMPHLFVVPCLALTLMLGPAGWLLYQAIRSWPREHRHPQLAAGLAD